MDISGLQRRVPDILSWGATAAVFFGTYFDRPWLVALGFGIGGFIILMGAFTGEPLGWNWIPLRLRYVWASTLGSWLILVALGIVPLFCYDGVCDYVWPETGFEISSASEASMNFDQKDVRPFLSRVGGITAGWSEERMDQIVDFRGVETTLVLQSFMDDIESPDLYFFTSPELAGAIQVLMEEFAAETEAP